MCWRPSGDVVVDEEDDDDEVSFREMCSTLEIEEEEERNGSFFLSLQLFLHEKVARK